MNTTVFLHFCEEKFLYLYICELHGIIFTEGRQICLNLCNYRNGHLRYQMVIFMSWKKAEISALPND